jgi:hypothetical protein
LSFAGRRRRSRAVRTQPHSRAGKRWTRRSSGEPGITIVPNLLATGILTLLAALAVLVWAALFVHRKHGGWILILLSVALLLVGGGVGPPLIGILAGVAGLGISAPYAWWRQHLPVRVQSVLAHLWP